MKVYRITISSISLLLIFIFSGYAAAKNISFSSTAGEPGQTATVSINVDSVSGIAGYNINFSYDHTVLTATGAAAGADAPPGFFMENISNPDQPGTVRLAMAGVMTSTNNGSGELATLTFKISGTANKNSDLIFTTTSLKDGAGEEIAGTSSSIGTLIVKGVTDPASLPPSSTTDAVYTTHATAGTAALTPTEGVTGNDNGDMTTNQNCPDMDTGCKTKFHGTPDIAQRPENYIEGIPSTYPLLRLGSNTILTATDVTRNYRWVISDWEGREVDSQTTGSSSYVLNPDTLFDFSGAGIYAVFLEEKDGIGLAASTLMVRVPMKFVAARFAGNAIKDAGNYNDRQGMDTYIILGGPAVAAYEYAALDLNGNSVTEANCGAFVTESPTDADNVFSFTEGIEEMIGYRVRVTLDSRLEDADVQRLIDSDLDEIWSGIFRVIPLLTYDGTIVETDGSGPIEGVTVKAVHDVSRTVKTDAGGVFSVTGLQNTGVTYFFKLTKAGYIDKIVTGAQIEAGPIKLERLGLGSGTIRGNVELSGSAALPNDVMIKARDVDGNYVTDGEGNVITVYTSSGAYTFPVPSTLAEAGPFTLEFRKAGYIYLEGTPLGRLTHVDLDAAGVDVTLKPVTQIMVTGEPVDSDLDGTYNQVLVRISAKNGPEATAYNRFTGELTEISVLDDEGQSIVLYAFASDGEATWSFIHNAYEQFSITVYADVTDDHNTESNYKATKVWTYVKTATAPSETAITDHVNSGGSIISASGKKIVTIPPGGLRGDITGDVLVSVVEANATDAGVFGITGSEMVEIVIMDESGLEIGDDRIERIEITMKFDPTVFTPGTLESGVYGIFHAESLEDMANGLSSQLDPEHLILPVDYTNGYVTFWVNHLSAFAIGGDDEAAGGGFSSSGGSSACFISASSSGSSGVNGGRMTFITLLMLISFIFLVCSVRMTKC